MDRYYLFVIITQKVLYGDTLLAKCDQYIVGSLEDLGADCKNQLAPVMSYTFPKPYSYFYYLVGITTTPMIPFFRKIRKKMADDNKPLKYMRYAIGEIALVVIGILIALSINNWNEAEKNKKKAKEYLKGIATEIQSGTVTIGNAIKFMDRFLKRKMWTITTKDYATVPTDSLTHAFGSPDLRNYKINATAFSKISDLSILNLIIKDSLVDAIIRYYTLEKDKYNGTIEWDMEETQYENNIINYETEVDFRSIFLLMEQGKYINENEWREYINSNGELVREQMLSSLNESKLRNVNQRQFFRRSIIMHQGFEDKIQESIRLLQKIKMKLDEM